MTNSNEKPNAISILDEVFQLLDESHLQQKIDIPIKVTAAEFDASENEEITFHSFLCIIGAFIKKVYQLKIFCNQQLSDGQAQSEAVAILDTFYRNSNSSGLMAAYLDARNAELDGFEFIIAQLTAILTQIAREKYIRWIFSNKIYSLDWPIKCKIVEIILAQNDRYLPADIKNCPPGILAARLPDLIHAVVSSELPAKEFLTNQLCTFDDQQSVEIETANHILLLSLLKSFI
jgi:hypothetical protein